MCKSKVYGLWIKCMNSVCNLKNPEYLKNSLKITYFSKSGFNLKIPDHVKKTLKMSKNPKEFEEMLKSHKKSEKKSKIFSILIKICKKNDKEWSRITILKCTFNLRLENVIF